MYEVAIVGGMGPAATVEVFNRIVKYTAADCDQDHIKMCILNDPTIPDRTDFLLNNGPSPLDPIISNIENAKKMECKYFAIPCNTAHCFQDTYAKIDGISFINMVEETCKYIEYSFPNYNICILGTNGTVHADVYKHYQGTSDLIMYPSVDSQAVVMKIIRKVKAGDRNYSQLASELMNSLMNEFDPDNTVFVLACTELSLLLPDLNGNFIDAMDVLAGSIVARCNKHIATDNFPLNEDYFYGVSPK